MATIKDVARVAKVSVGTVSRVLNGSSKISPESYKAVHDAARQLGYRRNAVAQALVSKTSKMFGVLVSDVGVPFFGEMVKGIEEVARQKGLHLLICNGYHDATEEKNMIEYLLSHRCQSLVVHSKGLSDEELIQYSREIPGMIVINRYIDAIKERCVFLNNHQGMHIAVSRLLDSHNGVAYIGSSEDIQDATDRYLGYQKALEDRSIEFNEQWVVHCEPVAEAGYKAIKQLAEQGELPSSIVTYNDALASGVLDYLHGEGIKIPEQVSVVGFDDIELARYLYPKLTTVRYPIREMAEFAANLSIQLLEDATPSVSDEELEFVPKLIERNSAVI
ncbi:LacI family DNA-binding transcriptional regulator [Vibrio ulleungensis]|uniref:LacI family DNA-binding transcriptional regulator n=1 Tax=Vibrio ulleungensis TaxID=2807619 RepID=A0ABS2HCL5_9VIBR|nr:LacI family DNA-binding transcriptional regulator [Vibrio ulleungensis]MBM7035328.1 LacI family DNA-binding transcriptional regulator [Vibrio ulleungensis]